MLLLVHQRSARTPLLLSVVSTRRGCARGRERAPAANSAPSEHSGRVNSLAKEPLSICILLQAELIMSVSTNLARHEQHVVRHASLVTLGLSTPLTSGTDKYQNTNQRAFSIQPKLVVNNKGGFTRPQRTKNCGLHNLSTNLILTKKNVPILLVPKQDSNCGEHTTLTYVT